MLPASHRLPSFEVRTLLRSGRRAAIPALQLVYRPNTIGTPRYAFVVSTKIDKRAVVRNRIKRLLRESVHHLLPQITQGSDAVIVARQNLAPLTQPEVESLVREILFQGGVLRG